MAKSRSLRQRIFLQAPLAKVFKALVEPGYLKKWFLKSGSISPRKGGNYTFTWLGGYSHSGKVLDYARDRKLSLSWPGYLEGKLLGTTRASFRIRPRNNGTLLDLTHSEFKAGNKWVELYGSICSGWAYFLTNLKSVLQNGRDLRSPDDRIWPFWPNQFGSQRL